MSFLAGWKYGVRSITWIQFDSLTIHLIVWYRWFDFWSSHRVFELILRMIQSLMHYTIRSNLYCRTGLQAINPFRFRFMHLCSYWYLRSLINCWIAKITEGFQHPFTHSRYLSQCIIIRIIGVYWSISSFNRASIKFIIILISCGNSMQFC